MARLEQKITGGEFIVTTELTPPKGTDLGELFEKAALLKDWVDAINLTESPRALMAVAPIPVARRLQEHGVEAIVQMTSRDRNRIAIQADLLGADLLGVHNFVFMGGDPPERGDHPDAKPVFDLTASQMAGAARALSLGHDLAGKPLQGRPHFLIGATVNPGAADFEAEVLNTRRKLDAGVRFLQTQAIYEPAALERFMNAVRPQGVAVLAGIIPLKSAKMGAWLNEKVPGIRVPPELLTEMGAATGPEDELVRGVDIAARTIRAVTSLCAGVHVMGLGWEARIPAILERSALSRRR